VINGALMGDKSVITLFMTHPTGLGFTKSEVLLKGKGMIILIYLA